MIETSKTMDSLQITDAPRLRIERKLKHAISHPEKLSKS